MPNDQTDEQIADYLTALDAISLVAMASGVKPAELAGALLARTQHYYLYEDPSDLDGLERLLKMALNRIENRPSWTIE